MNSFDCAATCPTCLALGSQWKQVDDFILLKCKKCGLVFLKDRDIRVAEQFFEDAKLTKNLKNNKNSIEYWSYPEFFDKFRSTFDGFFGKRLAYINRIKGVPVQSLLDIGCGYGFFLEYAKAIVPVCLGVDLNSVAIESGKARQLPVECRTAESLVSEERRFDAIVLADVLEHLADPLSNLRMCKNLLQPKGCLYIQVPNVIGLRLPYGASLGLPHHIWQFSPQSLFAMLDKAGYRVAFWNTGVMGVIGVLERGGPTLADRLMWACASLLRIGNRLQVIAVPR